MNTNFARNSMVAFIVTVSSTAAGLELIRNGSFEDDGFSTARLTTGWDYGEVPGFNLQLYPYYLNGDNVSGGNATFEFPPGFNPDEYNGPVAPNGAGDVFSFAWGSTRNVTGFGAQHVDVSNHAGKCYEFSAWLAGRGEPDDYIIIDLEFFDAPDASGQSLGLATFDGNDQQSLFIVGSLSLDRSADPSIVATQHNWTLYRATGNVPENASSAAVRILGRSVLPTGGGINGGFVDLVSLQVVPEPASVVLLGTVIAIVVVRRCATVSRRVRARTS